MTPDAFKLTYGTMFNPPEAMHISFETALNKVRMSLGQEHKLFIGGREIETAEKFADLSPADTRQQLGIFQKGTAETARLAVEAAARAFPAWMRTKWQDRIALVRKAADLMDERIYEMGAVVALEVGKNRMEALGDVAEAADLFRYACAQMEQNDGFIKPMGRDPVSGFEITNVSVMRPYGVWLVISPFNFPAALTGGPAAAALVGGNTVVIKPATDTPWMARFIVDCLRDAGIPDGVCNYVTGPGSTLGQALIDHPATCGVTFTGSFDVGMQIYRDFASGSWVRPAILEMGGKNPAIVSKNADLEIAATGIVRSAFGLQGQKCSACSRVLIEAPVYDDLVARMVDLTNKQTIGDPTERLVNLGPVINRNAWKDFQTFSEELSRAGRILTGGKVLEEGVFSHGFYCQPTLVADLPLDHPLWEREMFVPITTLAKVKNLDDAMDIANHVKYGLTAGFYGSDDETEWFFDRIEAGVNYANRPQGATTGAWPGFQPFGGWKGSGSTGKNSGGIYYLPLYMREQIQTTVRKG